MKDNVSEYTLLIFQRVMKLDWTKIIVFLQLLVLVISQF